MTQREPGSVPDRTKAPFARGPVQILVIEFEGSHFTGEILPELRRLQEEGLVNLVDLLVVEKDGVGDLRAIELSGLSEDERKEFGAVAGALVGLGVAGDEGFEQGAVAGAIAMEDGAFDERDIWAIEDAIPNGSAAAVAIIEHLWAAPLRDAVVRAGGVALADAWVHPLDLVAAGVEMSDQATA